MPLALHFQQPANGRIGSKAFLAQWLTPCPSPLAPRASPLAQRGLELETVVGAAQGVTSARAVRAFLKDLKKANGA
jgi:hypothetical protein